MNAQLMNRLYRLEPRVLLWIMAALVVFLLLEGWLLVLRQPLSDYARLRKEAAALGPPASSTDPMPVQIGRLEKELAAIQHKLQGDGPQLPEDQMVVYIIDRLARIADANGVRLGSVRPALTRRVLMFDEASFDIKVSGRYAALFEWLRAIEDELGPLVITRFAIKQADTSGGLSMELKLAAYRLAPANGGGL